MKFIHAADLHIDSPLRGLENYEGAPVERVRNATRDALRGLENYEGAPVERVRNATRDALRNLVQLCLNERADFLIVAGDLFDHDWKDFNTALFVVHQFQILDKAGIRVLVIRGNHDSEADTSLKAPWPTSDRFKLFHHKHAETVVLDDLGVAIHGMSFAERHVKENLLPKYPAPVKGLFNIGILHTNATGSDEHATYAPCTVKELVDKGYDYFALGHVHQYQVLNADPCHVVYSGNTQGRHIRETGEKGCAVVTVENGAVEHVEFVSTDVLRWKELTLELTADHRLDDLGELVEARLREELVAADGRLLGVRLRIQGSCAAHRQLGSDVARREAEAALRARVGEISNDVWLEKVKWNTRLPIDRDALKAGQDFVGDLLRQFDLLAGDEVQLKSFAECLQTLIDKTHRELQITKDDDDRSEKLVDFESSDQLREWLKAAEGVLLNQLTKEE